MRLICVFIVMVWFVVPFEVFACDPWSPTFSLAANPQLVSSESCLKQAQGDDSESSRLNYDSISLINDCNDLVEITPVRCDDDCQSITLDSGETAILRYPEDRVGETITNTYEWSSTLTEGTLSLSTKLKETDCGPCACSSVDQRVKGKSQYLILFCLFGFILGRRHMFKIKF